LNSGALLIVARLAPRDLEVDAFEVHDRRDGVEEAELAFTGETKNRIRQRGRGEGPRGHDHAVPAGGRQARHFLAGDRHQRMGLQPLGHRLRETVAVDGQRAAGRHLVGVAGGHDERAQFAHFGVQQAYGVRRPVVGAEGVRADQLR
jgi:hypothetical protein